MTRPPPGGRTVEDLIAEATRRAEDLRAAAREANEAAQNLKAASREHQAALRAAVIGAWDDTLRRHADSAMGRLTSEGEQVMRAAEAATARRIDRLVQHWLESEREDSPAWAELMAARQKLRKGMEAAHADRAQSGHPDHQPPPPPAGESG